MSGFTQGGYPPGCTQADHDRAFADEDRDTCPTCNGCGEVTDGKPSVDVVVSQCPDCHGTGFEPHEDTREDDAYDQSIEDADVDF